MVQILCLAHVPGNRTIANEDPQPRCITDVVSSIKVSKLCIVRSDLLQIEMSNTMIHYHMLIFPVCWDISNLLIISLVISIHMSQ